MSTGLWLKVEDTYPIEEDGEFTLPPDIAKEFWDQLAIWVGGGDLTPDTIINNAVLFLRERIPDYEIEASGIPMCIDIHTEKGVGKYLYFGEGDFYKELGQTEPE